MASIFTPNIDTVTVQAGKEVMRDVSGQRTKKVAGETIGMHKADRRTMAAAGVTN